MTTREQGKYRRWPAAALCALLVALAGCVGALTPSTGLTPAPATVAPTATPVSSPTAIVVLPTATPAPSPKPAPTEPAAPTVAPTPTDARFTEAQVIEVVDGDTIKVLVAGAKLTLRYIGIDTPEMSAADGAAARAQNIALVSGRTVRLEQDVSATDPYGRLLRYVWVGDLLVNAELVRLGYARAVAYPPDTKNQAQFAALQAEAQAARRGLWAHAAPTPAAGHELVQITGLRRDGAINPERTRRVRRDHEPGGRGAGSDGLAAGQRARRGVGAGVPLPGRLRDAAGPGLPGVHGRGASGVVRVEFRVPEVGGVEQ